MLWPKKHSYKEFDSEKNSFSSKIAPPPPPPITFLMVRPLNGKCPKYPTLARPSTFTKWALNLLPKELEHSGSQACPKLR